MTESIDKFIKLKFQKSQLFINHYKVISVKITKVYKINITEFMNMKWVYELGTDSK